MILVTRWVDHALSPAARVRAFARGQAEELADFADGRVELKKTLRLTGRGRRLGVRERLSNRSGRRLRFLFASEMNLNLKDAHVNRTGEVAGVRRFSVVDPLTKVKVNFAYGRPARLWCFPRESGSGARRSYQGACLTALWPVDLPPRGAWSVNWQLSLESPDAR